MNQQHQVQRPQYGAEQYHDLIAFLSYNTMQLQMALARSEATVKVLAQQLTEAQSKLKEAAEQVAAAGTGKA